ncbi:unnamed protein product [Fusarium fujikuroi]|nr:unnamed protein product [Fusarium fujikuroi]
MSAPIASAHLRVARPTNNIDALLPFYVDGLGFKKIGEFRDHDGFDGLMLGHKGAGYHLEFTAKRGHDAGRSPTQDTVTRMEKAGIVSVTSFNPYWDQCGKTFEDADGYRVVLANMSWNL